MATVSIKMDDITKTKFSEFCESVGLTTSAVINMFAKRVVRDNKIPFEITGETKISDDPFWQNEENLAHLRESVAQAKAGKTAIHELIEVD